jgi:hypothetical protein
MATILLQELTNTSTSAASQDIFCSSLGIGREPGIIEQDWI